MTDQQQPEPTGGRVGGDSPYERWLSDTPSERNVGGTPLGEGQKVRG